MEQCTMSLVVARQFGALNKITTIFSRKGCDIQALTAVPAEEGNYSRVTVAICEPPEKIRQMYWQLCKLEDVQQVKLLEE